MNKYFFAALLCGYLFEISFVYADGFYRIDTSLFTRIEVRPNNEIWLQPSWSNSNNILVEGLSSGTSAWSTNNIRITPPAGIENAYISVVLTAISSKRPLIVYTTGSGNTGDMPVNRIQME